MFCLPTGRQRTENTIRGRIETLAQMSAPARDQLVWSLAHAAVASGLRSVERLDRVVGSVPAGAPPTRADSPSGSGDRTDSRPSPGNRTPCICVCDE